MMKSFTRFTGIVAPLDVANVDTDAILPEQFLKNVEKTGIGEFLFHEWRYENGNERKDFILNKEPYRNAPVLLSRHNFGCGTSNEHATSAIAENGIRVIIAASFSDDFYENSFKNGILPIQFPEKDIEFLFEKCRSLSGYQLSIDLENQKVEDSLGYVAEFEVTASKKNLLFKGSDEIGLTL